jgi:hypothetical protein
VGKKGGSIGSFDALSMVMKKSREVKMEAFGLDRRRHSVKQQSCPRTSLCCVQGIHRK